MLVVCLGRIICHNKSLGRDALALLSGADGFSSPSQTHLGLDKHLSPAEPSASHAGGGGARRESENGGQS